MIWFVHIKTCGVFFRPSWSLWLSMTSRSWKLWWTRECSTAFSQYWSSWGEIKPPLSSCFSVTMSRWEQIHRHGCCHDCWAKEVGKQMFLLLFTGWLYWKGSVTSTFTRVGGLKHQFKSSSQWKQIPETLVFIHDLLFCWLKCLLKQQRQTSYRCKISWTEGTATWSWLMDCSGLWWVCDRRFTNQVPKDCGIFGADADTFRRKQEKFQYPIYPLILFYIISAECGYQILVIKTRNGGRTS